MPLPISPSSLSWDQAALAWMLTYLVHSSLLLSAAWLLSRLRQFSCCRLRETLWKAALLGGLLTAGLQAVPGLQPLGGSLQAAWLNAPVFAEQSGQSARHLKFLPLGQIKQSWRLDLQGRPPAQGDEQAPPPLNEGELSVRMPPVPKGFDPLHRAQVFRLPDSSAMAVHVGLDKQDRGLSWAALALGAWMIGAGALLLRLAAMKILLRRRLRQRTERPGAAMAAMLERLCRQAGLAQPARLTFSDQIPGPIVLGRREICVPWRAEQSLAAEQQRSLLAHELAHIVRRDPRWLLISALLECLFFFQPLNRLARRRLQEEAEYLCDDWVVGQTGQGVDLARCLAEVACWIDSRPDPVLAPGMAGRRSIFVNRVQRLCQGGRRPAQARGWKRLAAVAALLASVSLLAPVVSVASPALNWTTSEGRYFILRLKSDDAPHPLDLPTPRKVYRL